MHYCEIDYRKDWMRELFIALNQSFVNIQEKIDAIDWYDGIFAKEQIETVLGIAFVAAQTYITGTISDIRAIKKEAEKRNKFEFLSIGELHTEKQVTKILVVDSMANYYKHNEEWDGWKVNGKNRKTIETLKVFGITDKTEFPCYEAATMLWSEMEMNNLNNLLNILVNWREKILIEMIHT
ncbi:MAG: hypothetical protein JRI28_07405 [Deltaproteobacteria bacterium]|nr:hypothetical protein [Deltaproteobacteria bacterium]